MGAGSVKLGIALDSRSGAETGGATISLTLATGTFAVPSRAARRETAAPLRWRSGKRLLASDPD